ncbi:hypothetical protein IGI04_028449 [Brassica rapa subsp. trilocularis]|uniref:DUF4283 domain-containing protein n=1 Tax=Brassica rapa subsp. trilocularis TaxID=1813537 RepID=A0ABQ7L2Z5_BRACM|nr:hypothetical protein IGI04_028449 [Brassica rapa subsp. trilocularis]
MLAKKKKLRPPLALSFKPFRLARASSRSSAMAKKKNKSISLAVLGVAAIGASAPPTDLSSLANSGSTQIGGSVSAVSLLTSMEAISSSQRSVSPPPVEVSNLPSGSDSALPVSKVSEEVGIPVKNYAALLKSSAQLQELGTPSEHVSGVPFVLIPDENIEAAKLEFKDFIYARFHGDYPSMGKIIGVVNAVWAKTGPRIFVHNIGQGRYLLRVTNPKSREVLLSRTCWNIGGLPMFVAPWSPDYSPDEPPLTSAIVPVEMRNVPYMLFNKESLSRIATAVGKPDSLAPETERKENFEVAKLYVRVDLTAPLPHKIISGFSNGREVQIDVSYPWLPVKCDTCKRFGHKTDRCPAGDSEGSFGQVKTRKFVAESARRRSKSRPGRTRDKLGKNLESRYVPVVQVENNNSSDANGAAAVASASEAVTEMEDTTTTEPSQDEAVAVLEKSETTTTESAPEVEVVSPTKSLQFSAEIGLEEGEICEEGSCQDDKRIDAPGYNAGIVQQDHPTKNAIISDEMLLLSSEPTDTVNGAKVLLVPDDGLHSALPGVVSLDPNVSVSDTGTSVGDTNHKLLADPSINQGHNDYPEEDRDNPFLLVKNRKCGRKVTKLF